MSCLPVPRVSHVSHVRKVNEAGVLIQIAAERASVLNLLVKLC